MKLNLHCHSNFSDGVLTPEALASRLADEGAAVAALTDHDTLEGSLRFREALSLRGVAYVDAVELTTFSAFGEIHLLAYGVDAAAAELQATLTAVRGGGDRELRGFLDRIRGSGERPFAGRLETTAAIDLAHRCGGIAVLAHPLDIAFASGGLETLLDALVPAGLDGIEAEYGPYSRKDRDRLASLAAERGLCASAGTDFHAPDDPAHRAVLEVEESLWKAFRDRLLDRSGRAAAAEPDRPAAAPESGARARRSPRFRLGKYSARVIAASLVALGLFVAAIFALSVPYFEKTLLERKKELIRELTAEAVSLIDEYAADERAGRATREEAQRNAVEHIRGIRYGREGKDYFWITDRTPRMLLHPYRPELEGVDVSGYQDDNGLRVFYEFERAVREREDGYVEYLWQWKDDARRIVPKLSYVKRFDHWGWIIGTGIYLEDVNREIDGLSARMAALSAIVAAVLAFLLAFIARQSLRVEAEKKSAESAVVESKERYRALAEASSEGMAIVLDGTCTFANEAFLALSGYGEKELVLVGLDELLAPYEGEEEELRAFLASLPADGASVACLFRRRSGELVDAAVGASAFSLSGKRGSVLSVREAKPKPAADERDYAADRAAALVGVGRLRARLHRRASVVAADPVARERLGLSEGEAADLGGRFADYGEWEAFYARLVSGGAVVRMRVRLRPRPDGETEETFLTASVDADELGGGRFFSAVLEAPGDRTLLSAETAEAIAAIEAASRLPDERLPVEAGSAVTARGGETVRAAAERMTRHGVAALVVTGEDGTALGLVSDADLRARVTAEGLSAETPVGRIMTAPLAAADGETTRGQALALLRGKGVGHLAVLDERGAPLVLIGRDRLARAPDEGFAALAAAAREARDAGELARLRRRMIERAGIAAEGGLRSRLLTGLIASVEDAVAVRTLEFAERDLGPAPRPFAFLSLGSGGRSESMPSSDQDNAIVYSGGEGERSVRDYFLSLGAYVCGALNEVGVPYCAGGVMAKREEWCASLDTWKRNFSGRIASPEGAEMLSLNISFDFRAVAGTAALAAELRTDVLSRLARTPSFIAHLAREAVRRVSVFPQGSAQAEIDLKELSSQFVLCARLYALAAGVAETNTYRRLTALGRTGRFSPSLAQDCAEAHEAVAGIRLRRGAGSEKLPPKALGRLEEAILRSAYAQSALLQKKIAFDFPGAAI